MEEALCDEIVDQSNDIPGPLFNLIFTEEKDKQVNLDAWYATFLFLRAISSEVEILYSLRIWAERNHEYRSEGMWSVTY